MAGQTASVSDEHDSHKHWDVRVRLINDLMGGTWQMQLQGAFWLPREPGESYLAWKIRLERTVLFNGFRRMVDTFCGKVFQNPILYSDPFDSSIQSWLENIDLQGRTVEQFARDVFQAAMLDGLTHILVDFPREPALTLETERRLRPYCVHIPHSTLFNWFINPDDSVHHVRYKREVETLVGWEVQKVTQIVVLYAKRFEVYQESEVTPNVKEWALVDQGPFTIDQFPLITIYTNRMAPYVALPPLEDMAYLNLQHWRSNSDQEHILHVARVPILFGKGFQDDQNMFEIGPNRMIKNTDPASDLKYVEHTGAAIEAGRNSIKDIEDRMAMMGLEVLIRRPTAVSATARIIDSLESESVLGKWVESLEKGIQQIVDLMAAWAKIKNPGTVTISRDFAPTVSDSMEIEAILRSREAREISRERFWYELKRRGILTENFSAELEIKRLQTEPNIPLPARAPERPPIDPGAANSQVTGQVGT